jgi:hypothetical protein
MLSFRYAVSSAAKRTSDFSRSEFLLAICGKLDRWPKALQGRVSHSLASVCVSAMLVICCSGAKAQSGPNNGILPFSTHDWGIDLASSAVYLDIPLRSKAGKIPYSSSLVSTYYYFPFVDSQEKLVWGLGGGPVFHDTAVQPLLTLTNDTIHACPNGVDATYTAYSANSITDGTGAQHMLNEVVNWARSSNASCQALEQHQATGSTAYDHSGWSLYVGTTGSPLVYDVLGHQYTISNNGGGFSTIYTDPDGASISWNTNIISEGGQATDSLGATVLTLSNATSSNSVTASYTDVSGTNTQTYTTTYSSSINVRSNFGCSGIGESSGAGLATSVQTPTGGGYTLTYEPTPNGNGFTNTTPPTYFTGRIANITLPSGGSISYQYSGGNNGIYCDDYYTYVPTLTVTVNDNNGNSSVYTYIHSVPPGGSDCVTSMCVFTVTKTDPAGNQTVYTFYGELQTQVQYYQGTASGTPLKTVLTCYNGNTTTCTNPPVAPALPITQTDVYTSYGTSASNHVTTTYDSYQNVTSTVLYDFGATTPTLQTYNFYGQSWNGTSCAAYPTGTYIFNTLCYTHTQNSSSVDVAKTQITYSSTGHPLTVQQWTSGSNWLTSTNAYGTNGAAAGVLSSSTDVNGATTTYSNFTCNGMLPGTTTLPQVSGESSAMTTSEVWNCNGGLPSSTTDANGQITKYGYVNESGTPDPLWRRLSLTDPLSNVFWTDYSPGGTLPETIETYLNFPASSPTSTKDHLQTLDGIHRVVKSEMRTAPGASTFDQIVSYTYGWQSSTGACTTQPPFTTGACKTRTIPGGSATTTMQSDALGRTLGVTDGGGGTLTGAYNQNDALTTLGPAPTNENNKRVQQQYDGLGRLTQSCAIGNGSTTACGQNTGTSNGVTTSLSYAYPASGTQISTVTSTRGVQSRSTRYDAMGRVTQVVTPETGTLTSGNWVPGTWSSSYDATAAASCKWLSTPNLSGRLSLVSDPNGDQLCYSYDSLGRTVLINANNTTCRHFYYDNQTGYGTSIPSGVTTPTYSLGRMIEAATDSCSSGTLITDEWFSYNQDGQTTDSWELTPHSGQYYHSKASFAGDGAITSVQLASPSLYTMTWGLDGEGRSDTLSVGSTTLVSGPTSTAPMYDAGGRTINVQLTGTTPDQDIYTYDQNTGRMTGFEFEVGNTPANLSGTLTWNPNGTLAELKVVDGFNSGGSETCYSNSLASPLGYGYDDWGRLLEFDCGSGNWGQEFSYDNYDNLTKTIIPGNRTGTTWIPGYTPSNNHCNGCTYDANGDVTGDGNDVYGWNEFAKLKWTATSGTPSCGTSGRCITYDAFGRIVEQSNNSAYIERWITQLGETAYMNGTTPDYAYWPAPGGLGEVLIVGTTSYDYLHYDWLGNARITSGLSNHVVGTDQAYTPYGELYNIFGSGSAEFETFAGLTGNFAPAATTPVAWDTPNRELSMVGRWLSPDPAGNGWNQYGYPTDPNTMTDPTGLGGAPLQTLINNSVFWKCHAITTSPNDPNGSNAMPCGSFANSPCFLDGLQVPCNYAMNLLGHDVAALCPNNDCQGYNVTWGVNPNTNQYWLKIPIPATNTTTAQSTTFTFTAGTINVNLGTPLLDLTMAAYNWGTISATPPQPPPPKPRCNGPALWAGAKAAFNDFFTPPGEDQISDLGDALRDKNVQRAGFAAAYLTADALKLAAPVAEVGAKFIPVVGEAILLYQVGSAAYAGWKGYTESVDQCYGGGG